LQPWSTHSQWWKYGQKKRTKTIKATFSNKSSWSRYITGKVRMLILECSFLNLTSQQFSSITAFFVQQSHK
jgi:hypothetical protein